MLCAMNGWCFVLFSVAQVLFGKYVKRLFSIKDFEVDFFQCGHIGKNWIVLRVEKLNYYCMSYSYPFKSETKGDFHSA